MRALDRGESFVVTRNGVAVGELSPVQPRRFVDTAIACTAFAGAPHVDSVRRRDDVDSILDQDATPRARYAPRQRPAGYRGRQSFRRAAAAS